MDIQSLKSDLTDYLTDALTPADVPEGSTMEEFISTQVNQISTSWFVFFINYDPATALENVDCAVLAVNGEKDLQVPPKENLAAISNALKKGGNKKVTIIEFPNLNHLFQESDTGSPSEYATIEQTFSPTALEEITRWILKQTN